MTTVNRTPLVLGEVFTDTRRVLTRNGPFLLLLALVVIYPSTAATNWLGRNPAVDGSGVLIGLANSGLAWLTQVLSNSFFIAVTAWITARTLENRDAAPGEALREGLRFTLPVLIVQALFLLGMLAGMVLLVVPGVILALMWVLVTPALVVERLGITEAFGRSRALTKGHRGTLLGLLLAATAIMVLGEWLIFQLTAGGKTFFVAAGMPINAYGVAPLIGALTSPISMVATTAIYLRLRHGRHGSADVTAEVFA
jgi:hypothetical protein